MTGRYNLSNHGSTWRAVGTSVVKIERHRGRTFDGGLRPVVAHVLFFPFVVLVGVGRQVPLGRLGAFSTCRNSQPWSSASSRSSSVVPTKTCRSVSNCDFTLSRLSARPFGPEKKSCRMRFFRVKFVTTYVGWSEMTPT
ncbi:hypothetical protein A4G99_02985 [Haladaptatus sp. R4]|nr:hypothetical protein A4G99_02985 [Haladaptatus sp. R4]